MISAVANEDSHLRQDWEDRLLSNRYWLSMHVGHANEHAQIGSTEEVYQFVDKVMLSVTEDHQHTFNREQTIASLEHRLYSAQIDYLQGSARNYITHHVGKKNENIDELIYPRAVCYIFTAGALGLGVHFFYEYSGARLIEKQEYKKVEEQLKLYADTTQTCHAQLNDEASQALQKAISQTAGGKPANFVFEGQAYTEKQLSCVQTAVANAPPVDVPDTATTYIGTSAFMTAALLGAYGCYALGRNIKKAAAERHYFEIGDEVRKDLIARRTEQLQSLNVG